jgi:hypothetical protein
LRVGAQPAACDGALQMDIYTVYVDLWTGASLDDYDALKQLMRKEFRISPITPVGRRGALCLS